MVTMVVLLRNGGRSGWWWDVLDSSQTAALVASSTSRALELKRASWHVTGGTWLPTAALNLLGEISTRPHTLPLCSSRRSEAARKGPASITHPSSSALRAS